ncbi:SPOR domain-containing protein [Vibrio salinus]|uniref:SPOR domain-containing protein n=1 Tax=Vibrio salinus TaxID=2899784 RepID=UPI001E3ACCE8|nr:SPOR domain-containing protein [Vibrio salinus]MCE0492978.1 SPOR domain-containing protein [Vibrio salinus]
MASRFQNRLVGTIILVSIGVIILPDVFDGKKTHFHEEIASVPLKPEMADSDATTTYEVLEPKEVDVNLPESPVKVKEVQSSVNQHSESSEPSVKPRTVNEKSEINTEVREVAEKNNYKDSAWLIQLMALKNADNAKKLVSDLQKRGYQAHTKVENGFTRVIIGPDVSKSKLERQLTELEKITGAKGRLIKFKPLNP